MATATVNSNAPAPVQDVPVAYENFSYALVRYHKGTNEKQEPVFEDRVVTEESANNDIKPDEKTGKASAEILIGPVSFRVPYANTDAGVSEVCTSERERVKLFNNGLDVKLRNKARALIGQKDEDGNYSFEAPAEGAVDLSEYASVETATRGTTTLEKTKKLIANLPPDQMAQLMAMLQAQQTALVQAGQ